MGSLVFDFLNDSVLFDEGCAARQFAELGDKRVVTELVRYRDHVLSHLVAIGDESIADDGALAVLGNAHLADVAELTKAAFYFDTVILTDPLFSLTPPPEDVDAQAAAMSGVQAPWQLDRVGVAAAVTLMRSLRFAVATGYVRFTPDTRGHVSRVIPVLASDNLFASLLPQEIRDLYYDVVKVDGVSRAGVTNGFRFEPLSPETSEISVRFAEEVGRSGRMWGYRYMETDSTASDEPGKILWRMRQVPAGEGLSRWVVQSVNRAAADHFSELEDRMVQAVGLKSGFLVDNAFEQRVLAGRRREDISTFGGDCIVNLDVPVLPGIPLDDILRVRADDGLAFANFRSALQGKLRGLRHEKDPVKTRAGVEDAVHELGEIQRTQIDRNMQSLRKKALFDVALGVASLAAAPASPWTLAGALAAVVKAREHYASYRSQADNPAFFLWRVKGAAR